MKSMIGPSLDWTLLRDEISGIDGLSAVECVRLGRSYAYLETLLQGALFKADHPFWEYVYPAAAWNRRRIVRLAEMLKRIEGHNSFSQFCKKLAVSNKAGEAMDVLDVWNGLVALGCEVEYEPSLKEFGWNKCADLRIIQPQDTYIEIGESRTSDARREYRETSQAIAGVLLSWPERVVFAFRLHRGIPSEARINFLQTIHDLLKRAQSGIANLDIPGLIEIGAAPLDQIEVLGSWGRERNLKPGDMTGVPVAEMERKRINWKIQDKSAQLPGRKAGLLFLYSDEIFLQATRVVDALAFLEAEIRDYPQISALMLDGLYFPQPKEPGAFAQHQGHRIMIANNGLHWRCKLLVFNPRAEHPLNHATRRVLERMLVEVIDLTEPFRDVRTHDRGTLISGERDCSKDAHPLH